MREFLAGLFRRRRRAKPAENVALRARVLAGALRSARRVGVKVPREVRKDLVGEIPSVHINPRTRQFVWTEPDDR